MDQLELESLVQPSVKLAALQDDMDDLRRDLDRLRSGPSRAPTTGPSPPEHPDLFINVVLASANAGPAESFKPTFNKKYTPNEGIITSLLYVYKNAMEEARYRQKVKHIPSCLSRIAQDCSALTNILRYMKHRQVGPH